MKKDRYWKEPNYRVVIEYLSGNLYDSSGWAKDLQDAKAMFLSVTGKLTKLKRTELYFENQLIIKS